MSGHSIVKCEKCGKRVKGLRFAGGYKTCAECDPNGMYKE